METAVVAGGVIYHQPSAGTGTSLDAEWLALFQALDVAEMRGARDLVLMGDAASVVAKVAGRTRSRSKGDHENVARFRKAAERFDRVRLRHVKRSLNLAGIALTKLRNDP